MPGRPPGDLPCQSRHDDTGPARQPNRFSGAAVSVQELGSGDVDLGPAVQARAGESKIARAELGR